MFAQEQDYAQLSDAYKTLQAHANSLQEFLTASELQIGNLSMYIDNVEAEKDEVKLELNRVRDLWAELAGTDARPGNGNPS